MSKSTYGHVLVLPSRSLVRPASDDGFVKFSLTQYKSPVEVKVISKCFCQKALLSLMLQPID